MGRRAALALWLNATIATQTAKESAASLFERTVFSFIFQCTIALGDVIGCKISRRDGKRFVVHAGEKLTTFTELCLPSPGLAATNRYVVNESRF
jgi:hypothetical protein